LLLDGEHWDADAVERAAERARWALPRAVAIVAVPGEVARGSLRRLDSDVLAGSDPAGGFVIVPDPDGPGHRAALRRAFSGSAAAVGPTVAPRDAHRSLRLARLTLGLVERGVLPKEGPTHSDAH